MREKISKLPKEEANRVLELPNSYREKGREEGRMEGREKGREEGIEFNRKQLVFNMLHKGISHELITEVAELSASEFEKMKKEFEATNKK